MTRKYYPKWLYPKASDILPFTDCQIGAHLMNARRLKGLDEMEREARKIEIARMGAEAARLKTTPEQRSAWASNGAKYCNAKRWSKS